MRLTLLRGGGPFSSAILNILKLKETTLNFQAGYLWSTQVTLPTHTVITTTDSRITLVLEI